MSVKDYWLELDRSFKLIFSFFFSDGFFRLCCWRAHSQLPIWVPLTIIIVRTMPGIFSFWCINKLTHSVLLYGLTLLRYSTTESVSINEKHPNCFDSRSRYGVRLWVGIWDLGSYGYVWSISLLVLSHSLTQPIRKFVII